MRRRGRWALGIVGVLVAALVALFVWFVRNPLRAHEIARRRALVRAGFERADLGSGDERIARFVAGEGPGLLFLHGLGDQAGTWAAIAPSFTDEYRVSVPDLPGHGDSPPARGPLPMATIVAGAERLLAAESSSGPVVVVGNSLGAWVATLLAHRHAEKVARLVLVDGGPLRGEAGGPSLQPKDRREAARLMALLRDPASPQVPGFVLDDLVRRSSSGPIARLSRDSEGLGAHLLDGRLGEIATPVDLLWGASDRVVPLAYAERLAEGLPAVRLTRLEKCGHVPQLECPDRFLEALRGILESPPPAVAPPPAEEAPAEEP